MNAKLMLLRMISAGAGAAQQRWVKNLGWFEDGFVCFALCSCKISRLGLNSWVRKSWQMDAGIGSVNSGQQRRHRSLVGRSRYTTGCTVVFGGLGSATTSSLAGFTVHGVSFWCWVLQTDCDNNFLIFLNLALVSRRECFELKYIILNKMYLWVHNNNINGK